MTLRHLTAIIAGCALLAACAGVREPPPEISAANLAAAAGWQRLDVDAPPFVLAAWAPPAAPTADLTVYIEGDGRAWLSRTRPSSDPTPGNPLALRLALADPGPAVYLARPCQYVAGAAGEGCERAFWTGARFAPAVIDATDTAIDRLKAHFAAEQLTLVGYSGGGAVAALVAARRHDVVRLITVAGNLDHVAWTEAHAASPLTGSLNPADAWRQLSVIEQVHFVGAEDDVVGADVAAAYRARFPPGAPLRVERLDGFDHFCCWVEQWPSLLLRAR